MNIRTGQSISPGHRYKNKIRLPPGRGLRLPIHADDIASAVLAALDAPSGSGRIFAMAVNGYRPGRCSPACGPAGRRAAYRSPHSCLVHTIGHAVMARLRGPLQRLETDLIADNEALIHLLGIQPRPFDPDPRCWALKTGKP